MKIRVFTKLYRVKIDRIESANFNRQATRFRYAKLIVKGMKALARNRFHRVRSKFRIKIC